MRQGYSQQKRMMLSEAKNAMKRDVTVNVVNIKTAVPLND
jgi:hypothetical protein